MSKEIRYTHAIDEYKQLMAEAFSITNRNSSNAVKLYDILNQLEKEKEKILERIYSIEDSLKGECKHPLKKRFISIHTIGKDDVVIVYKKVFCGYCNSKLKTFEEKIKNEKCK